MHAEQLREIAQQALEEIKAHDIVVLDTRKLTSLFDYMGSSRSLRLAAWRITLSRVRSSPHCFNTCTSVCAKPYA